MRTLFVFILTPFVLFLLAFSSSAFAIEMYGNVPNDRVTSSEDRSPKSLQMSEDVSSVSRDSDSTGTSTLSRGLAVLNSLSQQNSSGKSPAGGHYGLYAIVGLTIFSLAPAILVMITSFTRIIIVLHFVRRALGLQNVPPNQVLMGLAIFLTLFSMSGLIDHVTNKAVLPYLEGNLAPMEALKICEEPVKTHLLHFVRDADLHMLFEVSQVSLPQTPLETPLSILIPAYVLGELRAAFIIGLVIFLPFLAIDILVSVVIQASGLTMLSPATVSLPFKLLLFVLVDGWALIIGSLVRSVSV